MKATLHKWDVCDVEMKKGLVMLLWMFTTDFPWGNYGHSLQMLMEKSQHCGLNNTVKPLRSCKLRYLDGFVATVKLDMCSQWCSLNPVITWQPCTRTVERLERKGLQYHGPYLPPFPAVRDTYRVRSFRHLFMGWSGGYFAASVLSGWNSFGILKCYKIRNVLIINK